MTLTDARLGDFLDTIKPNGAYAILATQRLGLEWASIQIRTTHPGVTVNYRTSRIAWPNHAWAALLSVSSDSDLHRLRGTTWDAVLLVYGDPEHPFPDSLHLFLESISRTHPPKTFSVVW